jgi:hypothetical protein
MFKNLKSLFIKESELKPEDIPQNVGSEGPITEENISAEKVATAELEIQNLEGLVNPEDHDVAGVVSEKFMNILLGAINKNNQEGFDYIEFKQSLQSLGNMDMDEQTKIKSAFAMAKTMGATKSRLLETAKYYMGILENESSKFNNAVSNQINQQIGGKKEAQKDIQLSIENKNKQIEQLKSEIAQLEIDNETVSKEISSGKVKVLKTKNDFQTTFNLLLDKIKKDIDLIEKYTS